MRHRVIRLAVVATATFGLAATTASGTYADHAAKQCKEGYFCLWEGPHQTGRLLFAEDAQVTQEGFQFPDQDGIEPPIYPQSARNPLPDDFGCIVRLNDLPQFEGDEQEVSDFGDHELDGSRVGSLTSDCG
ncbi:peptidase inhibitor family I36 protein [Saccharothrix sp. ST-888]|uniref:peptidase inhibitor family I36 protein n=1 Tax=Saccharothrix sp. ST-888 TaxID=1427391 RepID=UPI0005EC3853|nr:peptidase inhibitor family I36 protein [Saccharothrix sp. ST-888]KJK58683.1 hypothetical protein UK12_08935 [Saccharothrix sp. ST-888]